MKFVRVYTGSDGESHFEQRTFEFEDDGGRTAVEESHGVAFAERPEGGFIDLHNAPRRQYVLYLTASVELGVGDGSTMLMEPGDVLLAEDTTGRGHTSSIKHGGICAFVRLED